MRILFLAHRLPYPPNKGDKIRSFWELSTLSKRHEIDLFCFYDDPKDQVHVTSLKKYCRSCYAEPVSWFGGRARALLALALGEPFSTAFYRSRTMARRVEAAVKSRSYDVLFVFGSSMAQYAEPWPELPKVLDLVDVDSDKWLQYATHDSLRSWLWRFEGSRLADYESSMVAAFSNALVCTDAEASLLRSVAPRGSIEVLQNWMDTQYYDRSTVAITEAIRSLQPYVVFTGTMDYFPNIDAVQYFCREILPRLRAIVPDMRFVIAGRNPPQEVRHLAADPRILVTGSVPDIRPYLAGAAVSVAPMRIARGVQNKILEALALGIPVVASSAAASALPRELQRLLVAESDPDRFAHRVSETVLYADGAGVDRPRAVTQYMDSLELRSQLEGIVAKAVRGAVSQAREHPVEISA